MIVYSRQQLVVLLWPRAQVSLLLEILDNLILMSAPFVSIFEKINKKDH
jgi:hypothetical protein